MKWTKELEGVQLEGDEMTDGVKVYIVVSGQLFSGGMKVEGVFDSDRKARQAATKLMEPTTWKSFSLAEYNGEFIMAWRHYRRHDYVAVMRWELS